MFNNLKNNISSQASPEEGTLQFVPNAYVSKLAEPDNVESALNTILKKADIRQSFVERTPIISRPQIAGGILRQMTNDNWVTDKEKNYRDFMTAVNKHGGGMLFEAMNDDEIDGFMRKCVNAAKSLNA